MERIKFTTTRLPEPTASSQGCSLDVPHPKGGGGAPSMCRVPNSVAHLATEIPVGAKPTTTHGLDTSLDTPG